MCNLMLLKHETENDKSQIYEENCHNNFTVNLMFNVSTNN